MLDHVQIARETAVTPIEFLQVLRESGLAERRPVDQPEVIAAMLQHANLMFTARKDGRLIGIARSVTDFAYCCYLSDLAVSRDFQRQGVASALIDATEAALKPTATLILLSAPAAVEYYPKVGFCRHPAAFTRKSASSGT